MKISHVNLLQILKVHFKHIFIICFLFLAITSVNMRILAEESNNIANLDNAEHLFITYINNINGKDWLFWQYNYLKNIRDTHDKLYLQAQKNNKQQYFKTGEIVFRPLIIWFAFKDKTFSEPQVLTSSGSKLYDKFNCDVIKQSTIPDFPEDKKRLLMFEGNLDELINYLKKQGVLPSAFDLYKPINPFQINLDKI